MRSEPTRVVLCRSTLLPSFPSLSRSLLAEVLPPTDLFAVPSRGCAISRSTDSEEGLSPPGDSLDRPKLNLFLLPFVALSHSSTTIP